MRTGDMQIIPVNFQKRHREMLQWAYTLMSKRFIKVHSILQKLIVSLRTAIVIDDWKLDKQQTSHDDILDSFRLALCNYKAPKFSPLCSRTIVSQVQANNKEHYQTGYHALQFLKS